MIESTKKHTLYVHGGKLTEARIAANLSLSDVAKAMGKTCNKSSVSRWEQDKLNPSDGRVRKLVKLLGTKDFVVKGNKR